MTDRWSPQARTDVNAATQCGDSETLAQAREAVSGYVLAAEAAAADNSSAAGEKEPFKNDEKGLVREGTKEKETVVDKMDNVAKQEDNPFAVLTETNKYARENAHKMTAIKIL